VSKVTSVRSAIFAALTQTHRRFATRLLPCR